MVFFWSLFCQPCREEFGSLAQLAAHPPVPGLRVLAVNIDSPKLRPQAARFLTERGGGITGVCDHERADGRQEIAARFGVSVTPSLFLIDADGKVVAAWSGEVDEKALAASIGTHLAQGRRAPEASP